ncbi:fibrocystin-L-like [Ruditapes philippinarum]|uniref:fibrocystin-L-like n=1 Tax=Ruditapes philippinarum TaxID=129788 RepID=UPI00295C1C49|nr:fibrocystin-L-like [Ruditapes philippinarum]
MEGKTFTSRYGSDSTQPGTGNLLRVYVGPRECDLKYNDNFYGFELRYWSSLYGYLKCKTKGSSVGFHNVTYIVSSPYGRSMVVADLYHVSYTDEIYMFQTYTAITSISHSVGSKAGGLTLTIYGNHFDERAPYSKLRAYVGDTVCDVKNVTDEYVECIVAADPQYTASKFEGNRGVHFEYWTWTTKGENDLDNILSLNSSNHRYKFKNDR